MSVEDKHKRTGAGITRPRIFRSIKCRATSIIQTIQYLRVEDAPSVASRAVIVEDL